MNLPIEALLQRARDELRASHLLLDNDLIEPAASRAYYAVFYCAEAMLLGDGLHFSTHGALHATFGQRFAKTGRIDPRFHRYLLEAFRTRQSADYDVPGRASRLDVERTLQQAREFVEMAEQFLAGPSSRGTAP